MVVGEDGLQGWQKAFPARKLCLCVILETCATYDVKWTKFNLIVICAFVFLLTLLTSKMWW